jgi:sulfite exporter TauE/SafE
MIHEHPHMHHIEKTHQHQHPNLKQGNLASLSVGFIHGLAGVAHFLLFLPVIGFSSNFDSVKYIIGFAIGTLIAMISFAMVIGKLSDYSKKEHNATFFKGIRLAGGLFAFVIGIYWVIAN